MGGVTDITTADLTGVELRRSEQGDAEAHPAFLHRNALHLAPFVPTRDATRLTLDRVRELAVTSADRVPLLALHNETVIGQATISSIARGAFQNCTLGYSVDVDWRWRGLATRMVRYAVAEAFGPVGLHRVEAGTLLENRASQRVLTKAGFARIGISRNHLRIAGEWQDHVLYACTGEDYGSHSTSTAD